MPELPEVEVISRGVRTRLVGRRITEFRWSGKALRYPVAPPELWELLIGRTVTAVQRRAKFLEFHLDDGALMVLHLGMTGNLGFFPAAEYPARHDHLFWRLDNDMEMRFNDTRRFGALHYLSPTAALMREHDFYTTTGPEPFAETFNASYLRKLARNRHIPVKVFIMTNSIVAGIGNIYANESLFKAGILPARKAKSLKTGEWERLIDNIREVLLHAIDCGGSTISDFINVGRSPGYFQIHFQVYGRANEQCKICKTPISKVQLGGRASYFCSSCQK